MFYNSTKNIEQYIFKYDTDKQLKTIVFKNDITKDFEISKNENGFFYFFWSNNKFISVQELLAILNLEFGNIDFFQNSNQIEKCSDYNYFILRELIAKNKISFEEKFIDFLLSQTKLVHNKAQNEYLLFFNESNFKLNLDNKTFNLFEENFKTRSKSITPLVLILTCFYLDYANQNTFKLDGEKNVSYSLQKFLNLSPVSLYLNDYKSIKSHFGEFLFKSRCENLYLNGIEKLDDIDINELNYYSGNLYLNNIKTFDSENASKLKNTQVRKLELNSIMSIDNESITILKDIKPFFIFNPNVVYADNSEIIFKDSIYNRLLELFKSNLIDNRNYALNIYKSLNDSYITDKFLDGIYYLNENLVLNKIFIQNTEGNYLQAVLIAIIYFAPEKSEKARLLNNEIIKLKLDNKESKDDINSIDFFENNAEFKKYKDINSVKTANINKLNQNHVISTPLIIKQFGSVYISHEYFHLSPIYLILKKYIPNNLYEESKNEFDYILSKIQNENSFKLSNELGLKIAEVLKGCDFENENFEVLFTTEDLKTHLIKEYDKFQLKVNNWQELDFVQNENVKVLYIECYGMKNLDWLVNYPNLEELSIVLNESDQQNEITNIDGFKYVVNIKKIFLGGQKNKEFLNLSSLIVLKKLEELKLFNCSKIKDLNELKNIPSLNPKNVSIGNCDDLVDVSYLIDETTVNQSSSMSFESLPNAKSLGDLSNIKNLEFNREFNDNLIHELIKYPNLEEITINKNNIENNLNGGLLNANFIIYCSTIKLSGDAVKNLEIYSYDIKDFTSISDLPNLEILKISTIPEWNYSKDLITLEGIEKLTSLKKLVLDDVPNLASIKGIENCINLESLIIVKCRSLVDISPITKLKNLNYLNLSYCRSLALKPKPFNMNREELLKYQIDLLNFNGEKVEKELIENYEALKLIKPKKYSPSLVQKIKRLLNSGDINLIDSGLTLIKGLNEPKLFDTLLKDVVVYDYGDVDLQSFLRGSIENKPFKNYIFLHVSKMACQIDDSWKSFFENVQIWDKPMAKQGPLDHFVNLKRVTLRGFTKSEFAINNNSIKKIFIWVEDLTFDIKHLAGCIYCEELTILVDTLVNGLTELETFKELKSLRLSFNDFLNDNQTTDSFFKSISNSEQINNLSVIFKKTGINKSNPVSNSTFLNKLTKIETLHLHGISFSDGDFLEKFTSLNELAISNNPLLESLVLPKISSSISLNSLIKLNEIKAIEDSNIHSIHLVNCQSLKNLNFLKIVIPEMDSNMGRHDTLDFSGCFSLEDISGINHLRNNYIILDTNEIPTIFKSRNITKIKSTTLKSLKRIEQFINLLNIDLSYNKNLIDINDLHNVTSINRLNLSNCENLKTLKGLMNCKINYLNLCDTKSLEDVKDLEFMNFKKIYIAGSSIKKADIPERLLPVLDWRSRPKDFELFE